MSQLNAIEKMKLEKLFSMEKGYVLNFTNESFQHFVFDAVKLDIYEEKYAANGDSKAKRLRAFWRLEPEKVVRKLNRSLLEYWHAAKLLAGEEITAADQTLFEECMKPAGKEAGAVTSEKRKSEPSHNVVGSDKLEALAKELDALAKLAPQPRGFAFEIFLNNLFSVHKLAPRGAFRLVGEQIDGSFQFEGVTYLVEAKWTQQPIGNADLLIFQGKVAGKASWSRGLFVSYSGFSSDGLEAFSKSGTTKIVGLNGLDLHLILSGKMALPDAIREKSRRAAETGDFLVTVDDLFRGR